MALRDFLPVLDGRNLMAVGLGALGLGSAVGLPPSEWVLPSAAVAREDDRIAPFDYRFDAAAAATGISAALLRAIAETESGFRSTAVNPSSGAAGLMGFIPETARRYGVVATDATSSIFGAAAYLRDLLADYGDLEAALNVYGGDFTRREYAGRVVHRARRYDRGIDVPRDRCLTGLHSGPSASTEHHLDPERGH